MTLSILLAVASVLSTDRLAMADRLFNKGQIAEAKAEYAALAGDASIAEDELLYRNAECDRALGNTAAARQGYANVIKRFPLSKYVDRSRFMYAMGSVGKERQRGLEVLDSDRVSKDIRAAALYHLGIESSDVAMLDRCVKIDPNGRYAVYANLRRATLLSASKDSGDRRKGVELLLGIAFGSSGEMADEALYLAAIQSYREKKYGEAGSLFHRYLKMHPKGRHLEEVRTMSVWSDYMSGRYADAAAACGEGTEDDLSYIRASCAYATGDKARALELFRKYLADFPTGKYRADAELPIARIEFDNAEKGGDSAMIIESARRGFGISKLASDQLKLAWAYEKAGKQEEAQAEYYAIANKFPGTEEAAEALYRKAMIDAREDRWSAADLALAEALATNKIGKRKADALYWRGVAAMRLGHDEESVSMLREALAIGLSLDESREARLIIASADLKSGRLDDAKDAFRKLVQDGACERMMASQLLSVGKLLGGNEAKICANALIKCDSAEWRQAGYALLGKIEESNESYTAAIEAYRKCMAENANIEDVPFVSLRLGVLEFRAGQHEQADVTLKKAVVLNRNNIEARAEAYITLAKNCEIRKDFKTACAYATVIVSLFEEGKYSEEARKILAAHPEDAQP